MPRPVMDIGFWSERLVRAIAKGELHRSVFETTTPEWDAICAKHRRILSCFAAAPMRFLAVLDVGCGYGNLLDLMPKEWGGFYLGVDLSPDMIAEAKKRHPSRRFEVCDMTQSILLPAADVAVMRSIRPMVKRECGEGTWKTMLKNIASVSRYQLYLEYDTNDEGTWVP